MGILRWNRQLLWVSTIPFALLIATQSIALVSKHPVPRIDMRGLVSEGFVLTAYPTQDKVTSGQLVGIRLTMRNVSKRSLWFPNAFSTESATFIVQDKAGKYIPAKSDANTPPVLSNHQYNTEPGQSIIFNYPVSERYDLSNAGIYRIAVSRQIPSIEGMGSSRIVSNGTTLITLGNSDILTDNNTDRYDKSLLNALGATDTVLSKVRSARKYLDHFGCDLNWRIQKGTYSLSVNGRTVKIQEDSSILKVGNRALAMSAPAKRVDGQLHLPSDGLAVIATLCAASQYDIPLPAQLQ